MKHIIANWKMNMNLEEVELWLSKFQDLIEGSNFKNKILLACSFPYLHKVSSFCTINNLNCAAQDVSFYEKGAHTGDVGTFQLKDYCQFTLIGHSERKESREMVIAKRDSCLKQSITPVVCFTNKEGWEQNYQNGCLLAWEDPENISKGGVYREKDPSEVIQAYSYFAEKIPNTPVIYGGSVNRKNIEKLAKIENMGGVLVGNASLDPKHFLDIVNTFS